MDMIREAPRSRKGSRMKCVLFVLDDYDKVSVRSFVTAIVTRRARERLTAGEWTPLAAT
jgi:hypothetical protein